VNFVDEQHIAGAQVGENRSQVAGALDGRTGRDLDIDAHLIGDHVRQRRLAKPGRAVEQNVIERLAAPTRGRDQYPEILLDLLLPDQVG
jgi:hypothetical protein